jgi:hypothetical protein
MRRLLTLLALATATLTAQTPDPLTPLDFLTGTWIAATNTAGNSAGTVLGTYTFSRDLAGHTLERTGTVASCKGPQDFDCNHHDRLTVFPEAGALAALYLDNEGHVIHYTVTTPDPHTVVFLSAPTPGAPTFRLTYHLEGTGPKAVMFGKFQMAAPVRVPSGRSLPAGVASGSTDFHSYLEWSGTKQ